MIDLARAQTASTISTKFSLSVFSLDSNKSIKILQAFKSKNTRFCTLTELVNKKNKVGDFEFGNNFNPSRPDPGGREKINSNFYFHTSLWCLKRFYEGL